MSELDRVIAFIERLRPGHGQKSEDPIKLAPYMIEWLEALYSNDPRTAIAIWSAGRGSGKTALAAWAALATLDGHTDDQQPCEIMLLSRSREQARIDFWRMLSAIEASGLDENFSAQRAEMRLRSTVTGSELVVWPASERSTRGTSPSLVIIDEAAAIGGGTGHEAEPGRLWETIESGLGKVTPAGRLVLPSTAALPMEDEEDQHPFDAAVAMLQSGADPTVRGRIWQASDPNARADDATAILEANPQLAGGFGTLLDLQARGRRAEATGPGRVRQFKVHVHNIVQARRLTGKWLRSEDLGECIRQDPAERQGWMFRGVAYAHGAGCVVDWWPDARRLDTWCWAGLRYDRADSTLPWDEWLERGAIAGVDVELIMPDEIAPLIHALPTEGRLHTMAAPHTQVRHWQPALQRAWDRPEMQLWSWSMGPAHGEPPLAVLEEAVSSHALTLGGPARALMVSALDTVRLKEDWSGYRRVEGAAAWAALLAAFSAVGASAENL